MLKIGSKFIKLLTLSHILKGQIKMKVGTIETSTLDTKAHGLRGYKIEKNLKVEKHTENGNQISINFLQFFIAS